MDKYPTLSEIRQLLRYNLTKPLRVKIINVFVIGSEAKGTANSMSDLDIAVIIPKLKRKTSINFSEDYHSRFTSENQKPKWKNRLIDVQFFFATDRELDEIKKIPI